ncbi:MAG: ABC transporter substrate-binding protein [Pseudorhodobacter sp.]|nr:ABC transporter substrate-binding protein [Pseudorhodobacter sp.]
MYGEPALPSNFTALPQANPNAPKGGRITFGEAGSFDSLNPFITKGSAPSAVSSLTVETLMGRSYDEPFTLYGLLAETVDTDADRSYVAFTLREGAKFSDGNPVTVDDVLWSFQTLGEQGNPRYATAWKKVASSEVTGPRTVKFTFTEKDREMPLLLGLRPILEKKQWEGKDFTLSSLEAPIGSGPYLVDQVEAGAVISLKRNPDWWGKDLAFNQGLYNFDEIRYEYYADPTVMFEAFKAGAIDVYRESNPAKWVGNYDFPAVQSGEVVKDEIAHKRPSGIDGLVFNTRKPIFADWRVREALIQAFNFELINQTLNNAATPRITSYYSNSELSGDVAAPASPAVAALLEPFKTDLLPGALEGYSLPVSDGTEANRAGLRKATDLLGQAGWTVQDGVLKNAAGEAFAFEILLANGESDTISAADIFVEALKRLGIQAKITTVDSAQYKERTTNYDFDMTHYIRSLSLSPGNEQTLYWGHDGVEKPGTRNWMGMNSPAAEALIKTMVSAQNRADFVTATQALDRVLTTGRYVIPFWYSDISRVAHKRELHYPAYLPIYGDWLGFLPDTWWYQQ